MKKYPNEIEEQIRDFYKSLAEKERRRYAGLEATKLGYGHPFLHNSNFHPHHIPNLLFKSKKSLNIIKL